MVGIDEGIDEIAPAYFLSLVIAKLEEHILATIMNKTVAASEGGHEDLYIPDAHAKKANLTICARPANAKISLYFFGRISTVPTKGAIRICKARASTS